MFEKLLKKNNKLTSCFALILLSIIIVSNANTAYGSLSETDTEILEPNSAAAINIADSNTDDIITVEYEVLSGHSIDVYLRDGFTMLLLGPPADYIKKDNDSYQGKWSHTVTSDDSDNSVVFHNEDLVESSTVKYTITRGSTFGNILDFLYIIVIVIGLAAAIVAFIARSKKKKRKSVEPELMSEPTTQTIVNPLPGAEIFCSECGKKILEGNTFCTECGHQI
ncbi:MAG: zinc ribbon domain-containing protein [Promethearchaeota archaeon]